MPAHVHIDAEILDDAKSMARETYMRFAGRTGYYYNTINSHLVGKIGELACVHWAASMGVDCDHVFRDAKRESEADLILMMEYDRRLRVEVKTWSSDLWQPFGRCVSTGQMPGVTAKADIVMWCIVDPLDGVGLGNRCTAEAEIMGWNTPADIAHIEPTWTGPIGRQRCNHQVPMEQVRPLDHLVAWLRGEA